LQEKLYYRKLHQSVKVKPISIKCFSVGNE
jgi:hypothetical protein